MAHNAPGEAHRQGISLTKLMKMFPDDAVAGAWIAKQVWPDGARCPYCGTANVREGIKHRGMTHRCRECPKRPMFSMKTATVTEGSKLGYQVWALAIYAMTTNLKGVSAMKLHRDLEITYKSAWHLMRRLRKAHESGQFVFSEPVEADETCMGGREKNKH